RRLLVLQDGVGVDGDGPVVIARARAGADRIAQLHRAGGAGDVRADDVDVAAAGQLAVEGEVAAVGGGDEVILGVERRVSGDVEDRLVGGGRVGSAKGGAVQGDAQEAAVLERDGAQDGLVTADRA